MNKRILGCIVAFAAFSSTIYAENVTFNRRPEGSPTYYIDAEGGVANGGTQVYANNFPQISPNGACGGLSCEDCGDYGVFSIWTSGNRRYIADDITLGAGPRQLVRYDVLVCGFNNSSTNVNITTELWSTNVDGLPGSAPGAPIAGTQSVTPIVIDNQFPCFVINVKTAPVILSNSLHLVVTSSFQSATFPVGTFIAVMDGAELGSSLNQFRETAVGLLAPNPNTNADWSGPLAFGATPNCPGAAGCGSGCTPHASIWAHVYTQGSCGNGVVEPGEACDSADPCCQGCQIAASGFQCRASADACDAAESCDGISDLCPPDGVAGAGTPCRISAGPCDPAESCDGSNMTCPPDVTISTCTNGDGCCPSGCNNGNDDDCAPAGVPTVSEWGLAILTLIGLVVGTILFSRKRSLA